MFDPPLLQTVRYDSKLWPRLHMTLAVSELNQSPTNDVNPDQPAPSGAGWSGFKLFGQACLSNTIDSAWAVWSQSSSLSQKKVYFHINPNTVLLIINPKCISHNSIRLVILLSDNLSCVLEEISVCLKHFRKLSVMHAPLSLIGMISGQP